MRKHENPALDPDDAIGLEAIRRHGLSVLQSSEHMPPRAFARHPAFAACSSTRLNWHRLACTSNREERENVKQRGLLPWTPPATVDERFGYDAFGKLNLMTPAFAARTSSVCDWNFLFHAEFQDGDSGLYNYGYRYFHPELGRWLSRDPIGEKGGLNLFSFLNNYPVANIDNLGLSPRFPDCCKTEDDAFNKASEKAAKDLAAAIAADGPLSIASGKLTAQKIATAGTTAATSLACGIAALARGASPQANRACALGLVAEAAAIASLNVAQADYDAKKAAKDAADNDAKNSEIERKNKLFQLTACNKRIDPRCFCQNIELPGGPTLMQPGGDGESKPYVPA